MMRPMYGSGSKKNVSDSSARSVGEAWTWSIGRAKTAFQRASPLDWTSSRLVWPPVLLPTITIRSRAGSLPCGSSRRRISRSDRRTARAAVGSE